MPYCSKWNVIKALGCFLALNLFGAEFALGQSNFEERRYSYRGVRGLAMGGAQTAVVNDETALYINPANLLRLRDIIGTALDFEMEFSNTFYTPIYQSKAFGSPTDPEGIVSSLDSSRGAEYYFRYTLSPTFVTQYFGLGVIANQIVNAQVNEAGDQADVYVRDDQGAYAGIAARLFSGHVKIGGAVKVLSRIEMDEEITLPGNASINANGKSGSGLGYDAGMVITLPVKYHPTLSVVGRNIGNMKFDQNIYNRMSTVDKPETLMETFDVAFALFPIHGGGQRSVWTYEISDLRGFGLASDKIRHSHFGYEFNYNDVWFLRAGLNQRYWTFGLEFASERTQFQIATYGEDVGQSGSPEESRRFVLKWSLRF